MGGVGDAVLCLDLAASLSAVHDQVWWLCAAESTRRFIVSAGYPEDNVLLAQKGIRAGFTLAKIRSLHFETAVAAAGVNACKAGLLMRLCGIRHRCAETHGACPVFFNHALGHVPELHVRQVHGKMIEALGFEPVSDVLLGEKVRSVNFKHDTDRPILAVHPGSARTMKFKRWDAAGFAAVALRLKSDYDMEVICIGGPDDRHACDLFVKAMHEETTDYCCKTSIIETASLIKNAALLLCNDTAMVHLAGYLGTAVTAVYGPTDPARYGPWGSNDSAVTAKTACAPCAVNTQIKCTGHELACLEEIKPDMVLAACRQVLDQAWRNRP